MPAAVHALVGWAASQTHLASVTQLFREGAGAWALLRQSPNNTTSREIASQTQTRGLAARGAFARVVATQCQCH